MTSPPARLCGTVPRCPVCASAYVALHKTVVGYVIWHCRTCSLYWVPGADAAGLRTLYERRYFDGGQEYGYPDYLASEPNHRKNARDILGFLERHGRKRGRLLD